MDLPFLLPSQENKTSKALKANNSQLCLYGIWRRDNAVSWKDPALSPLLTQKTWQETSIILFRRTLVQCERWNVGNNPHNNGHKGKQGRRRSLLWHSTNIWIQIQTFYSIPDKLQNFKLIYLPSLRISTCCTWIKLFTFSFTWNVTKTNK